MLVILDDQTAGGCRADERPGAIDHAVSHDGNIPVGTGRERATVSALGEDLDRRLQAAFDEIVLHDHIHRYGQRHTAQVYNLVLSDTIEDSIFLLLEDKLVEIAKTLGKLDEHGNVAEDLRSQILGQLSEGLDHPFVANQLRRWQSLTPEDLGICVQSPDGRQGVLSVWRIESRDGKGRTQARIVSLACGTDSARIPTWEKKPEDLFSALPASSAFRHDSARMMATTKAALFRELEQRGLAGPSKSYRADVVGWIGCY